MPRKSLRIALLLAILALTITLLLDTRAPPPPDWDQPLHVVIYPHNADGSEVAANHIAGLDPQDFAPITEFFAAQAARHGLGLAQPFELTLGPEVSHAPSTPPASRNLLSRLRWGLTLRWWHFRFRDQLNDPDIIVIARYLDPDHQTEFLHSVAIAEYRVALTKLLASQQHYQNQQSLVIIAHEILHTVGASDLYDPHTGIPRFPEGFADPEREPRYPQSRAELMAPRIPVSPHREQQADSLDDVTIGEFTAREINWPTNP